MFDIHRNLFNVFCHGDVVNRFSRHAGTRQDCHFAVAQVHNLPRMTYNRGCIRGGDEFILRNSHGDRTAVARHDEFVRFVYA